MGLYDKVPISSVHLVNKLLYKYIQQMLQLMQF